jgi:hypothetical protein
MKMPAAENALSFFLIHSFKHGTHADYKMALKLHILNTTFARDVCGLALCLRMGCDRGQWHLAKKYKQVELDLTEADKVHSAVSMAQAKNLYSIRVKGNWFEMEDLRMIVGLRYLHKLHIAFLPSGEAIAAIVSMQRLHSLTIEDGSICESAVSKIASMSGLRSLSLRGEHINCKELAKLQNLTSLTVTNTTLGDSGIAAIQTLLGLQALDIKANWIGPLGLTKIAEMRHLHTLVVSHNACISFDSPLFEMSGLHVLDVCDTHIGHREVSN